MKHVLLKYAFALFLATTGLVNALVHHLAIHNDDRTVFKIETFGFIDGGKMKVRITDFSLHFSAKELDDYRQVEAAIPHNQSTEVTLTTPVPKPSKNSSHVTVPPPQPVTVFTPPAASPVPPVTSAKPTATAAPAAAITADPRPPPPPPAAAAAAAAPAAAVPMTIAATGTTRTTSPVTATVPATVAATTAVAPAPAARMPPAAAAAATTVTTPTARAPPAVVTTLPAPAVVATPHTLRRHLQAVTSAARVSGTAKNATKPAKAPKAPPSYLVGFVMRHASSESAAQADLERIIEKRQCILEHLQPQDVFIDLSNSDAWKKDVELSHEVTEDTIGLYSLVFARCYPAGVHYASFKLDATFYNPGPNYLSAGDTPLPALYFGFFALFSLALIAWIYVLRRDQKVYGPVHSIHYMMLILLVLKCLSLFFEGVRYHYISLYGVSEMWSMVYYVFAFLKGVMLFTVILLIGSGWSLMKSYLNDKEKRIIWVVLILQVLDNIAMIVLEETAPGSQGWQTWRDLLHLVDIVCCCAILLPIVWSIQHLRQAAEVDGKAQNSLQKLQLFRQFYIMVVVFVYFTRIVVYVLASTVPFYLLWLGPLSTEVATLLFYTITGFKFRPAVDNPYMPVRSEDAEGQEYGLEDDEGGVLLQAPSRGKIGTGSRK